MELPKKEFELPWWSNYWFLCKLNMWRCTLLTHSVKIIRIRSYRVWVLKQTLVNIPIMMNWMIRKTKQKDAFMQA